MGFLHEGHASLIRRARGAGETVVVSLFVNPKQFGPQEDFSRYPRDMERDLELCRKEGVDLLFAPGVEEIYPPGFATEVRVHGLDKGLCAEHRPGHFAGVATVVLKLLNLVGPDRAYFGQKDLQQWRIISQMVADLGLPVEIVRCPIIRDRDGLALSSRNSYLSPDDRRSARAIPRALAAALRSHASGQDDAVALIDIARRIVDAEPGLRLQYLELVSLTDLNPRARLEEPSALAIAAMVGQTRLIDNVILGGDAADEALLKLEEACL